MNTLSLSQAYAVEKFNSCTLLSCMSHDADIHMLFVKTRITKTIAKIIGYQPIEQASSINKIQI